MDYKTKLNSAITRKQSVLCIGIDPDPELIPAFFLNGQSESQAVYQFCASLIAHTQEFTAAYKINTAYFEALGSAGFKIMFDVAKLIPPECILIADAKRGDVNHTAQKYRTAFFDKLEADAITINPLMGFDTIEPFSNNKEKCVYALALTSNSGSSDFLLRPFGNRATLSRYIAEALAERQIQFHTTLGMVIGATQHSVALDVLEGFKEAPLLIPGIGQQGGKIADLISLLEHHDGQPLVTISRAVSYPAYSSKEHWSSEVVKIASKYQQDLKPLSKIYV